MNKCPNKSHSDWKYAVEKLGEDKTLFIYDRLGQEIPTKEQVDSIVPSTVDGEVLKQNLSTEGIVATEKTIRDLGNELSDRIGIKVNYISDRTREFKGRWAVENEVDDEVIINLAHATLDTPIHELLAHPIIRSLRGTAKHPERHPLYDNLLKELEYGVGKDVLDRIKQSYIYKESISEMPVYDWQSENLAKQLGYTFDRITEDGESIWIKRDQYVLEDQQEEAIVELLGLLVADKLNNVKDGKVISLLKRLLNEIKAVIRSLLNKKEITINDIPDNITINDLADLLAYSNSKIILPGYEVIYTTPDNQKFRTYSDANKHISELANIGKNANLDIESIISNVVDGIKDPRNGKIIKNIKQVLATGGTFLEDENQYEPSEPGYYKLFYTDNTTEVIYHTEIENNPELDKFITNILNNYDLLDFIEKNKEYETGKEVIETWKKANNIVYDPQEIYDLGQGFYSSLGAYSNFDVELMLQNLITHIEHNKKAGGEFVISAYTKPNNKRIRHLEDNSNITFKIFPKSEDIKWAANADVFSGSVWDAAQKINKSKGSELAGISYTKYPSVDRLDAIQHNLTEIVENLQYHHNELGIALTGTNFRLEVGKNVPNSTRKLVETINSILDEKFGKLQVPELNDKQNTKIVYRYFSEDHGVFTRDNKEELIDYILFNTNEINPEERFARKWIEERVVEVTESIIKKPRVFEKTPLDDVKNSIIYRISKEKIDRYKNNLKALVNDDFIDSHFSEYISYSDDAFKNIMVMELGGDMVVWKSEVDKEFGTEYYPRLASLVTNKIVRNKSGVEFLKLSEEGKKILINKLKGIVSDLEKEYKENPEKIYTDKLQVNLKVTALKEAAVKYPRSLIRSQVVPIRQGFSTDLWEPGELPFQKLTPNQSPTTVIESISTSKSVKDIEQILMGYKGIINSKRHEGKVWLKAMNESTLDHVGLFNELAKEVNAMYPGLISLDYKQAASFKAGRGIYEVVVNEYAWDRYINKDNDQFYKQGTLFKRNVEKDLADLKAKEVEEIKDFFSLAGEITNMYDYLDMMETFFGNVSDDHRKLIVEIRRLSKLYPNLKVEQVTKSQLPELFDTDEEVEDNQRSLAFYRNGKVFIIKDQFYNESKSMLLGTAIHEILHDFTYETYDKWDRIAHRHNPDNEQLTPEESQFIKEVNSLFQAAKKRTKYKDHNAYRDLGEFIADGISDQTIIDELKTMKDDTMGMSFWQWLKQIFGRLFGMDYTEGSYHQQLLSSILDYTYKQRKAPSGVHIIHARKIKDNTYINYDNPTHNAIVNTLSGLEEAYDMLPEKFDGVTTMMRRLLLGGVPYEMLSPEKQAELDKYAGPGTETHYQIEKGFKSYIKSIEHKYNLTPEAAADLSRYFDKFKKPGVTILSEVKVFHWVDKMIGKIDLVVIDENNKVHLFDFKTKINGFENFDRDYFPKKGEPHFWPMSSYKQSSMQLTAYANMWKEATNTDVETMQVIPLKPTVNQETGMIERYELDRSFNGKDIIDIERSLWMPILYGTKAITMNKEDNQDVVSTAEQAQLISETAAAWRNKIEKLDTRSEEQELLLKIVKSLEHTIEITRKRSPSKKFKEQVEWVQKILKEEDTQKALSYAVDIAFEITRKSFNELKKIKASGDIITPAMLYRFKDSVSAFNILDEYETLLSTKYDLYIPSQTKGDLGKKKSSSDFETLRSKLNGAIQYKNAVKADYERIGLELMATFLYPFYTKVKSEYKYKFGEEYRKIKRHKLHGDGILDNDPKKDYLLSKVESFNLELTEKEYVNHKMNAEKESIDALSKTMIRKELKKAGKDISTLEAWIDNMLDSPDAVTAALVKAFVIYDDTARIEIERTRLEMLPVVREWEEYTKQFGKDYQKAYNDMLERDLKTNELTGHLVSKFHSSLIKEYRNLLAITSSMENVEEKELLMKIWKDINMPLDEAGFQKAYLANVEQLYADNLITEEERTNLVFQSTKRTGKRMSYKQMVEKNYITDGTEDKIIEWLQKNTWKYRNPSGQWINPQWQKLNNILQDENDPRTKMYNMLISAQNRADDMVPSGIKLGTRLPGVIKQKNERLASGQNVVDFVKGSLSKSLDFKVDDTHRVHTELLDLEGNARYFVPVHFTGIVTKTVKDAEGKEYEVFDAEEQSFDLANIYYNYLSSAIDFQWKNNLLPEMEMHRYLLQNRDVVQRDAFNNIKYRASRIFGGNKSELDEVTIKGGNISQQFDTWLLYALYGQAEKDLGVIPGTNIDAGKLLGNIQQFTALNLLGLNFVSGVANLGLGEILQGIEAIAGQYVDIKEYHKAQDYYMKNLPGIMGDIESLQPDNIVSLLLREFNVLHDHKTRNLTDSRFAAAMTTDTLFFTNHMGEHKMQTTFMLATLAHRRAYNKKGEDIGSMLDHYKVVDGKLKLDEEVDEEKSDWENIGRRTYEHYVRGILTRLHGAYSDLERVAIQQNAITSMAYMFRKFIVPGFRRRWGARRYEERTEEFVEGNYRTTLRFANNLIKSLRVKKALMLSREWALMSDMEKANIIRSISEIVALIIVTVLASVAVKFAGDDDKEGDLMWNFIAYQTLRLKSELLFFSSPTQTMKILRSPAASITIVENTLKLLTQLTGPGWEDYQQGPWKDHMKIEKTLMDMTIGVKQYYKLRDIGELVDVWKI